MNESTSEDGRRQSILKSRQRLPLRDVPFFYAEEDTVTLTRGRRVSFGRKQVKEYFIGSAASTVHDYEKSDSESLSEPSDCSGPLDLAPSRLSESINPCAVAENDLSQVISPPESFTDTTPAPPEQRVLRFTEGCINIAKSVFDKTETELAAIIIGTKATANDDDRKNMSITFSNLDVSQFQDDNLNRSRRHDLRSQEEIYLRDTSRFHDESQLEFLNKSPIDPLRMSRSSFTQRPQYDDDNDENVPPRAHAATFTGNDTMEYTLGRNYGKPMPGVNTTMSVTRKSYLESSLLNKSTNDTTSYIPPRAHAATFVGNDSMEFTVGQNYGKPMSGMNTSMSVPRKSYLDSSLLSKSTHDTTLYGGVDPDDEICSIVGRTMANAVSMDISMTDTNLNFSCEFDENAHDPLSETLQFLSSQRSTIPTVEDKLDESDGSETQTTGLKFKIEVLKENLMEIGGSNLAFRQKLNDLIESDINAEEISSEGGDTLNASENFGSNKETPGDIQGHEDSQMLAMVVERDAVETSSLSVVNRQESAMDTSLEMVEIELAPIDPANEDTLAKLLRADVSMEITECIHFDSKIDGPSGKDAEGIPAEVTTPNDLNQENENSDVLQSDIAAVKSRNSKFDGEMVETRPEISGEVSEAADMSIAHEDFTLGKESDPYNMERERTCNGDDFVLGKGEFDEKTNDNVLKTSVSVGNLEKLPLENKTEEAALGETSCDMEVSTTTHLHTHAIIDQNYADSKTVNASAGITGINDHLTTCSDIVYPQEINVVESYLSVEIDGQTKEETNPDNSQFSSQKGENADLSSNHVFQQKLNASVENEINAQEISGGDADALKVPENLERNLEKSISGEINESERKTEEIAPSELHHVSEDLTPVVDSALSKTRDDAIPTPSTVTVEYVNEDPSSGQIKTCDSSLDTESLPSNLPHQELEDKSSIQDTPVETLENTTNGIQTECADDEDDCSEVDAVAVDADILRSNMSGLGRQSQIKSATFSEVFTSPSLRSIEPPSKKLKTTGARMKLLDTFEDEVEVSSVTIPNHFHSFEEVKNDTLVIAEKSCSVAAIHELTSVTIEMTPAMFECGDISMEIEKGDFENEVDDSLSAAVHDRDNNELTSNDAESKSCSAPEINELTSETVEMQRATLDSADISVDNAEGDFEAAVEESLSSAVLQLQDNNELTSNNTEGKSGSVPAVDELTSATFEMQQATFESGDISVDNAKGDFENAGEDLLSPVVVQGNNELISNNEGITGVNDEATSCSDVAVSSDTNIKAPESNLSDEIDVQNKEEKASLSSDEIEAYNVLPEEVAPNNTDVSLQNSESGDFSSDNSDKFSAESEYAEVAKDNSSTNNAEYISDENGSVSTEVVLKSLTETRDDDIAKTSTDTTERMNEDPANAQVAKCDSTTLDAETMPTDLPDEEREEKSSTFVKEDIRDSPEKILQNTINGIQTDSAVPEMSTPVLSIEIESNNIFEFENLADPPTGDVQQYDINDLTNNEDIPIEESKSKTTNELDSPLEAESVISVLLCDTSAEKLECIEPLQASKPIDLTNDVVNEPDITFQSPEQVEETPLKRLRIYHPDKVGADGVEQMEVGETVEDTCCESPLSLNPPPIDEQIEGVSHLPTELEEMSNIPLEISREDGDSPKAQENFDGSQEISISGEISEHKNEEEIMSPSKVGTIDLVLAPELNLPDDPTAAGSSCKTRGNESTIASTDTLEHVVGEDNVGEAEKSSLIADSMPCDLPHQQLEDESLILVEMAVTPEKTFQSATYDIQTDCAVPEVELSERDAVESMEADFANDPTPAATSEGCLSDTMEDSTTAAADKVEHVNNDPGNGLVEKCGTSSLDGETLPGDLSHQELEEKSSIQETPDDTFQNTTNSIQTECAITESMETDVIESNVSGLGRQSQVKSATFSEVFASPSVKLIEPPAKKLRTSGARKLLSTFENETADSSMMIPDNSYSSQEQIANVEQTEVPAEQKLSFVRLDLQLQKTMENQAKEDSCLWTLVHFQPCDCGTGEICFKFPLLNTTSLLLTIEFAVIEKTVQVTAIKIDKQSGTKYQHPSEVAVNDYGYHILKSYIIDEEKKMLEVFAELPYFIDFFNAFSKRVTAMMEEALTLLQGYAGSTISDKGVKFRLYSYPYLMSCYIEVNLRDALFLDRPRLAFYHDMGHLDESAVYDVSSTSWTGNTPLLSFVRETVNYIVTLELEKGRLTKRIPYHF